ncbi:hypothetical protein [Streptomyces sp. NPDC002159]
MSSRPAVRSSAADLVQTGPHAGLFIEEDERTKLRAFVEVDRTTMSSQQHASQLIEYTRL